MLYIACFDDHGFIDRNELEEVVKGQPLDFVLYGGDHSIGTVELIAEATMGIKKYALRGNHDNDYIELAFSRVGAENLHGKIIETDQGLIIGGFAGSHQYKENRANRTLLSQYESLLIACEMITELQERNVGMDILFSHDQAFIKAYSPSLFFNDGSSHCGLIGNTWLTCFNDIHKGIEPVQHHIHGHLHQNYQTEWPAGQIETCVYGIKLLQL